MSEVNKTPLFEQQLLNREAISMGPKSEKLFYVTDLMPDDDANISPPVLLVPSVLGDARRFLPATREFWENGRRTLVVEHAHTVKNTLKKELSADERLGKISPIELGRAALLSVVLDTKGIQGAVDVVGSCEGAVNASLFTYMQPERARSLVLVSPSGIGNDTLARHMKYFAVRTVRDLSRKISESVHGNGKAQVHPLLVHAENPLFHLRSLYAAIHSRIDPLLNEIEDKGVRVGVLKGSTDRLYPPARTEQDLDVHRISGYEVLADPRSGHNPLINLPKATVQAILGMQQAMCEQA